MSVRKGGLLMKQQGNAISREDRF